MERSPTGRGKIAALLIAVAIAGAAGWIAGRRSAPAGPLAPAASGGAVVARFDGRTLTVAELEREIATQPAPVRERLSDAAARRAFVDDWARTLLLAHRAEARGYQRDPEFARRYAQELAGVLVEKDFEAPERARVPSDDELRAWFAEHEKELQRPERMRIALVAFQAPDAASREQKRAAALAALGQARASASDHYAFGNLARLRSEDPRTRATNGEVPPMSKDELADAFGPELAAAAFEGAAPGTVLPRVVEASRALYVVKVLAREPEQRTTFEDSKELVRRRLAAERRTRGRQQFLEATAKEAGLEIDAQVVAGMKVGGGAAR